ncbi:hypothetical protein [Pseudomonas piscis]|uniref:MarR family transcriptional regulator n=1 Tax=Pseudomonas piscis TaxID=2614538 RepID=A0A7X1U3I6_9PSED|nr:hypothetical protein [Pseudomonas piscis]MQA52771.1 hypothetical protein [Pseudomonas piscis]
MTQDFQPIEADLLLLAAYIETVLGDRPTFATWSQAAKLPHYLTSTYSCLEMKLLGQACIVLMQNQQVSISLPDIKKHLQALRKLTDAPLLLVAPALASYERKRLIEAGVQFIVPGNQLFIPELGLDLREYFRARQEKIEHLSPATQAMLIHLLMNNCTSSLQLSQATLGQPFKYSKMTISRAVKELKSLDLVTLGADRQQHIEIHTPARQLWRNARKHMRSPTRRTLWLNTVPQLDGQPLLLAGESALAGQTLLVAPRLPIYACSSETLASLQGIDATIIEVARDEAVCALEIWTYEPTIYAWAKPWVDPFSLLLSLQESKDERIQIALGQLEEDMQW